MALVITELDPGGAELCLTELACYLADQGHQPKVWSLSPAPQPPRDKLWQRLKAAGVNVEFGNARGSLEAWRISRWLRAELVRFQPDIVQSMLWHANVLSAWSLRRQSVPLIGGMRVSEPRRSRWWLERVAARRMQSIVCVSRDVLEHAASRQGIPRDKLRVIPNGVPDHLLDDSLDTGDWKALHSDIRTNVVLFAGRLESQKGVEPLVTKLPALLRANPTWSLVLLGQGSLQTALQQQIDATGMNKQIHLVGWQPSAPMWMKASQLLVLPANYEGMPNVLLESMAIGKAFLAFAVDGVGQLVEAADGYPPDLASAQLVPPGRWDIFEQKLQLIMHDEILRQKCGAANRQHIGQHFRLRTQLEKYTQCYINARSAT